MFGDSLFLEITHLTFVMGAAHVPPLIFTDDKAFHLL
jgi:hypothetical protein